MYMGVWKTAGETRGRIGKLAEVLTRPIRIWARYLLALYHQLRGRLVIFDRYVYEALLPAKPPLVRTKRAYFWLLAHLIPRPTVVAVLDVPGDVAYSRKQENPPHELEFEREMYAELAARIPSLEFVDAAADADSVSAELTAILWRTLAARWRGVRTRS